MVDVETGIPKIVSKKAGFVSKIFVEDRITLEFMAGAMFSPCGLGPTAPVYNYEQNNIRLGWMLDSPNSWGPCADLDSPLRGNFEAIFAGVPRTADPQRLGIGLGSPEEGTSLHKIERVNTGHDADKRVHGLWTL